MVSWCERPCGKVIDYKIRIIYRLTFVVQVVDFTLLTFFHILVCYMYIFTLAVLGQLLQKGSDCYSKAFPVLKGLK